MIADPRVDGLLDVIMSFARLELDRRAPVSDALDEIDGLATGLNLLAEELQKSTASRKELEAAYRDLQQAEAKLLHASKLAAIGQLASTVAHEINNPSAFVLANQQMILEHLEAIGQAMPPALMAQLEPRFAAATQMLRNNQAGMDRIKQIVQDLRIFSRIDQPTAGEVLLDDVVATGCNLVHLEMRHRCRLVMDLGGVPALMGDAGRLGQVVTNLLLNAAQAIPEGHADANEVRVQTRCADGVVVLVVSDTGCGIPEELRERIFEPFFTTKPAPEGTGLGLSLVAEIVKAHEGTITVESVVGRGTRFVVCLPLRSGASRRLPVGRAEGVAPERRKRVLVIDDEPMLLDAFGQALCGDHDVVVALGGAVALQILEEDRAFDVIVCDLLMPEVDGPMIYAAVVERAPQLGDRFVFCTGGATTPRTRTFLEAERRTILEKPFALKVLREVIARSGNQSGDRSG